MKFILIFGLRLNFQLFICQLLRKTSFHIILKTVMSYVLKTLKELIFTSFLCKTL